MKAKLHQIFLFSFHMGKIKHFHWLVAIHQIAIFSSMVAPLTSAVQQFLMFFRLASHTKTSHSKILQIVRFPKFSNAMFSCFEHSNVAHRLRGRGCSPLKGAWQTLEQFKTNIKTPSLLQGVRWTICLTLRETKTLIWTQPWPTSKLLCFRRQWWAPPAANGSIIILDVGLGFVQ